MLLCLSSFWESFLTLEEEKMKGALALLLFCAAGCALGREDYYFQAGQNDTDLEDLDLDPAPGRLPRQVKSALVKERKAHIQELSVNSSVVSRYALTNVRCVMLNRHAAAASQGVFHFPVPAGALVSNFTMIVAGRVYRSRLGPKDRRKKLRRPDGDKHSSRASSSKREVDVFRVAASIPGGQRAVFLLTYEELLRRRLGRYQHVVSLRPLQLVSRLRVDVTLADRSPIVALEVPPLRPARPTVAAAVVAAAVEGQKNVRRVTFAPSVVQQARMATDGVLGDLVVRYDVQRPPGVGDVQVENGHFLHFFAPEDLPPVAKRVVFVIDTSGSMLGTKMRQTKEALLSIVSELRAVDRFNFVGFSHKIKVWRPQRLVAVTPLNVRDAKKFIYTLMPTGGTDMDGALRSAWSLLRADRTAAPANASVVGGGASLVVLLTDDRPAAGGWRSAALPAGDFCVFALGVGDDADHEFLRRLSVENCGAARRVRREADTGAALRGLYREMATPLLSNIRMDYGGWARNVTPHLFADYFNGSELAVAGKLSHGAEVPRLGVLADGRHGTLLLETPAGEAESRAPPTFRARGDFAERAWAFLALKEALRSRWRGATAAEREEHGRRARHLASAYGFLTPLADMLLDRGQADPEDGLWPDVGGQVEAGPSKKSVTFPRTSADGDPHFVVDFPLSKTAACFDINGEPGHVLRLVSDHKFSGVTVNGKLVGAPPPPGGRKRLRTYFSAVAVVADRPARAYVEVTPAKVILDGPERRVLPCHSAATAATAAAGPLSVTVAPGSNVTVSVGAHVTFVVLLHRYKKPAPYQRDHLGFYIQDGQGLSSNCHGLLGQFLHEEAGVVAKDDGGVDGEGRPASALLKVRGRWVPVVRKRRRIYGGSRSVDCWFAKNNGARLVDGRYADYVAPHMFDTGDGPHGSNAAA
ncbi:inter-alpha-trypsin inhibitor heavy chain H5 [Stigmatopora nigra]